MHFNFLLITGLWWTRQYLLHLQVKLHNYFCVGVRLGHVERHS